MGGCWCVVSPRKELLQRRFLERQWCSRRPLLPPARAGAGAAHAHVCVTVPPRPSSARAGFFGVSAEALSIHGAWRPSPRQEAFVIQYNEANKCGTCTALLDGAAQSAGPRIRRPGSPCLHGESPLAAHGPMRSRLRAQPRLEPPCRARSQAPSGSRRSPLRGAVAASACSARQAGSPLPLPTPRVTPTHSGSTTRLHHNRRQQPRASSATTIRHSQRGRGVCACAGGRVFHRVKRPSGTHGGALYCTIGVLNPGSGAPKPSILEGTCTTTAGCAAAHRGRNAHQWRRGRWVRVT